MTTDRFHKAARDGHLDILKEATRKECNGRDETGTTPTLWAAFEGHLDALRLLCGRGGDPDKADHFGNTALHLAAARGHKECVTFLVNFGANLYSADIDNHTAQELAAINNRDDILRFLDTASAKLENTDKKKAKHMKEKAKKENEKHLKQYAKRQSKAEAQTVKDLRKSNVNWETVQEEKIEIMPHRPSVLMAIKHKMTRSSSQGNLLTSVEERPTYSALVGTVSSGGYRAKSAVQKKALASKLRNGTFNKNMSDDFKIGETEISGKRSVKSLTGVRRDSEVMYVGTFSNATAADGPQRGKITDVFTTGDENANQVNGGSPAKPSLTRSASQPDFLADMSALGQEVMLQEPASIFDRPGFGSVAFRRTITATLNGLPSAPATHGEDLSIGSAGSLAARQRSQQQNWERDALSESSEGSDGEDSEESGFAALDRFLAAWGLSQYVDKFKQEQIDLDALLLLTETDLKSLGLPLGPYRKLTTAIQERKNALSNPGAMVDAAL